MKDKNLILQKKLFCFDIFGVLHEGNDLFENISESMIKYKELGKVAIITNATSLNYEVEKSLLKKGLEKGIHYDEIFSSGDMLIDFLEEKQTKIDVFTKQKDNGLFSKMNEITNLVENIKDSEYIYVSLDCSDPDYNEGKYNIDYLFKKYNVDNLYDLINQELMQEDLLFNIDANSKNKKILCANCDVVAVHKNIIKVVQGFYGLYLRKKGFDVQFFGKPFNRIYKKALKHFNIDASDAVMFGDQYSTDLIGAKDCKIETVLINSKITNLTKNFNYAGKNIIQEMDMKPDFVLDNINIF